ncbi:hypothetical protein LXL04_019515 [Taraxacum kok-saghyz]
MMGGVTGRRQGEEILRRIALLVYVFFRDSGELLPRKGEGMPRYRSGVDGIGVVTEKSSDMESENERDLIRRECWGISLEAIDVFLGEDQTKSYLPNFCLIFLLATLGFLLHPLMESTTSSHEVLICQTCGDKGFTNAFIYCVKCLGFVVHRYCLHVITFDEFVHWVCEDCQQPLPIPSTSQSHKLNPKPNATSSPTIKPSKRKKRSKIPKKKRKIAPFVEERKEEESQGGFKTFVLALEAQTKGEKERKIDENVEILKEDKSGKIGNSIEHSGCDSSCTNVDLKNKGAGIQEPEHETATQSTCLENNNNNNNNSNVDYIPYKPAKPHLDPIWRGSFDITGTDYNLFEGLLGHLSNKAHYKVCEEANVLPSLLSLEMHPKATLWPKSFFESQPSDEQIGLYFFPGDTRYERDYEELVSDMIDEELAMKFPTKNAELLIFTSRVLPRPFWRFRGKNYLWGVFKGKKNDVANPPLSENCPSKVKTFDSQSPQSPLCNYR